MRRVLCAMVVAAWGCSALLSACASVEEAVDPSVSDREEESAGRQDEEQVALASRLAHERGLLTAAEVLDAIGDPAAAVFGGDLTSGDMHRGFFDPDDPTAVYEESPAMQETVYYALERSGDSRTLLTFVTEYVAAGPDIEQSFAAWEVLLTSHLAVGRCDPPPIGIGALSFEGDGGAGAVDRIVVVNAGETLVVIEANTGSPDDPDPHLADAENLTCDQMDALVRTAVEKLD